MISQRTIDQIKDLDLFEVISKFVDLKKAGANYMGLSPFTEEKSPSFSVSPSKGVWKCFSTGKGSNNPVTFVMELKGLTYPEALKTIAEMCNVIVEYDDSERSKKYIIKQELIRDISEVNEEALKFFESKRKDVAPELLRYPEQILEQYRVGYAPDSFDEFVSYMLQKGFSKQQLLTSGLAKENQEKTKIYSFFRGRIMFPIFTFAGVLIGFSGRNILPEIEGKKIPKYLNTGENEAYSKSDSLLGISVAKEHIRKAECVYKVEGNFDVLGLAFAGLPNTVAPLGTAFTPLQAKILKKFAHQVVIFADNDKAGIKALNTDIRVCLENDLEVLVFIPEKENEDSKVDADSFVREANFEQDELKQLIDEQAVDGVEYMAELFFKDAKTVSQKSKAETELAKLIALIPNQKIRNEYIKTIAKNYGIEKKNVESEVSATIQSKQKEEEEENEGYKIPSYISEDIKLEFKDFMFYEDPTVGKIGYYFPGSSGSNFERITNFLIRPIFQLGSASEGGRVCEITNGKKTRVRILPKDTFNNPSVFENELSILGDFRFDGIKKHLQKIRAKLYPKFVMHEEITSLGWHRDGFWAFADGIIDGTFKKVDKYGSVAYADKHYFLPAFSSIYEDLPEENDNYASDRKNVFRASKLSMKDWSRWMDTIYGDNGTIAVAFMISAVFRDFIYQEFKSFPMLFMFGRPGTGKTTCARSISSVFFADTTPFNLNNGTVVGFQRKLAAVKNAIIHLDEYTNALDEKKFQSLKGIYDGTGHEAGIKENSNRTKTTRINSSAMLSGQYLPTRDDNSLYTRSILLQFTKTSDEYSEEEKKLYEQLMEIQGKGLSQLIVEIIRFRDLICERFVSTRYEIESHINRQLEGRVRNGRVIELYSIVLAVYKLVSTELNLHVSYESLEKISMRNIILQSSQIQESNTLSKYWKIIEFMASNHQIRNNVDYKVVTESKVSIRISSKEKSVVQFPEPTRVVYFKFNKIHPLYMETIRKQTGEIGIPESSIMSYMKADKAWLGPVAVVSFEGNKSSAYAFRYDALNMQLEGVEILEDAPTREEIAATMTNDTLHKQPQKDPNLFDKYKQEDEFPI
jgi:DNA primase catalytic core